MKKLKLSGKLSLNKETVSRLNENEMANVKAGGFLSLTHDCSHATGNCHGENISRGLFCHDVKVG